MTIETKNSRREFEKWWKRKNDVMSKFKQGFSAQSWAWEGWKAAFRDPGRLTWESTHCPYCGLNMAELPKGESGVKHLSGKCKTSESQPKEWRTVIVGLPIIRKLLNDFNICLIDAAGIYSRIAACNPQCCYRGDC